MRLDPRITRGTLAALVALATVASLVGPASADRGRRYKYGPYGGPQVINAGPPVTRVVYTRRSSDAGPALAGFIGGLVLGSVISHAQPVHAYCLPPPCDDGPDYVYYDPYCRRSFYSLEDYSCRRWHHPGVVTVIEVRTGRCVGERVWDGEGWRDRGDDWDDRYQGDDQGDWNR